MTGTTGRHERHAARRLGLALALTAGIAVVSLAAVAGLVTLASSPASLPGPQVRAAAPAHHRPAVVRPKPHKRAERVYVTVRPGQCLAVIAAAHGISWRALYRANRRAVGADPDLIHAGLRLLIPRAETLAMHARTR